MAALSSRTGLIDYALRKLGHPVIEVNVDEDQLEDRVDEALQFYQQYHSDAMVRLYYKHQITSQNITDGYIDNLPEGLAFVRRILPLTAENSSVNMFDARYQIMLNDIFDLGHMGNLSNYVQIQQYMQTLNMELNGLPQVRFNRHMDRIYIDLDWSEEFAVGDYVIIDGYQIVDPSTYTDVYDDMYLKRYVTALIKQQWGVNLSKFEGMQLPGGVIINGRQIFEDANAEIEKLEEEVRLAWEMPVDFMAG